MELKTENQLLQYMEVQNIKWRFQASETKKH